MKHLLTLTFLCFGLLAQAQIPSYVPTNGLVGWWPFNGNANDESGNGNNGTVNGATLAADRFGNSGKAYSFSKNNDSITFGDFRKLDTAVAFSISIWFNYSAISSQGWSHLIADGSYADYLGWGILVSNSMLLIREYDNNNGLVSLFNSNQNTWYNLIATCVQGDSIKFYLNGHKIGSSKNVIPLTLNTSNSLRLGSGEMNNMPPNTNFYQYFGLLDDIAIYNRALSASEVQQLYSGGSAPTTASQQFHYQAVVNNAQNRPLKNQTLQVRFTIADSLQSYFSETQTITTDDRGHFATQVGTGTVLSGSMNQLPWWSAIPKSLETEIDTNGSGQWVSLGKQPLNAVPLAQYALRTGDGSYSLFGSFDTQGNIQSGSGFTVASLGNNQYEIRFSSAFTDPPVVQIELLGSGTFQHQTISASTQKVVVQITGNPDRIQFQAKGK